MSSIKHDQRRLFLFSWHATQKEATTQPTKHGSEGIFRDGRRSAGQNPWRWARTLDHGVSQPCFMRGGESLRGFDEGERASWLRIRSTHLELCMGGTSYGPNGARKATNQAAAGSGNGEERAFWAFFFSE